MFCFVFTFKKNYAWGKYFVNKVLSASIKKKTSSESMPLCIVSSINEKLLKGRHVNFLNSTMYENEAYIH